MGSQEESTTKPVTIYDVAKAAGVAPSTVSRAFSRPDRVAFATAEKIRHIAEELGYISTLNTRSDGRREQLGTIGVVVADISNPFFQAIIRGADHAAESVGRVVLAADIHESETRAEAVLDKLIPKIDGLVLVSSRLENSTIKKVARMIPTVVVNRPVPGVPSVVVDSYTGTLRAAMHLADQGISSITYIAGPRISWADGVRWRGLLDATTALTQEFSQPAATMTPSATPAPQRADSILTAASKQALARIRLAQLRAEEPSVRGGQRAFMHWRKNPTDAVLCFNDLVAVGFITQAHKEGITVPDDVLVMGYDNSDIAAHMKPSLTTVAAPLFAVGRVAAANVMALAEGLKTSMTRPRVLPTRLITRESTSRPPETPEEPQAPQDRASDG